jgi:hypothetical protein
MIKSTSKFVLLGVAALAIATMPLCAAENGQGKDKKEAPAMKEKAANRAIPFRGTLASKTDASITVGTRTFEITSETKIVKDGKPATLADGEVGKPVAGSYQEADGKLVAKMIRFGPKPEGKETNQPEKPKKEKKDK